MAFIIELLFIAIQFIRGTFMEKDTRQDRRFSYLYAQMK